MASVNQSGGNSILLMGVQTALGSPVQTIDSPGNAAGKMLKTRFPMTGLTVGEQSDSTESGTILGGRRAVPSQRGQLWASGEYSFEVLPDNIQHIFRLLMHPSTLPSGTSTPATEPSLGTVTAQSGTDPLELDTSGITALPTGDPPSRVKIAGTDEGTMTITGKRRIGKPSVETITHTETVNITSSNRVSTSYWAEVSAITISSDLRPATGTTNLTWDSNTKRYAYTFNSSGSIAPMTLQMTKGNVPEFAYDMQIDTFTLSIAEIVTATLTMTGKESQLFTHLPATGTSLVRDAVKLPSNYLDNFPTPDINFFPRWGGALTYNGNSVPFTGLDMEVNNNPDTGESEITGSRFRTAPIYGARKTTVTPTVLFAADDTTYDAQENWQASFRNGTRAPLVLEIFNFLANGRRERIVINCPTAELNASPVVEVSSPNSIPISLAFDCGTPSSGSELTVTIDGE